MNYRLQCVVACLAVTLVLSGTHGQASVLDLTAVQAQTPPADITISSSPHHNKTRVWVDFGQGPAPSQYSIPHRYYVLQGEQRIGVAKLAADGSYQGWLLLNGERFELSASDSQTLQITPSPIQGNETEPFQCGSDTVPISDEVWQLARGEVAPSLRANRGLLIDTVVAVDTDNEFNFEKFGNNQQAALDWIADLYSAMNVMYQRDLGLNLVLGDVFLRLDTDNPPTFDDDPWVLNNSPADQAVLQEFGAFWSANMGAVDRVFAMLLSGKSPSGNSSSGIAWVNAWCQTGEIGGGYSVTQVFTNNLPVINDVRVIAHEIGHNAGSPHTHCYNPVIDTCFSGEFGCYTGSTSCPAAGSGTMMSYCHFGSGCGVPNRVEFHPTVINLIDTIVAGQLGSCLMVPPEEIFADSLEDIM